MKALLIFTVIIGHFCEITTFHGSSVLYMLIYVFHMPAFAFCSGMFANFNKRKILENFVYPYLIFQTLYVLFDHYLLHNTRSLQYTTPYWLMWYMLAMILWECALPLFQESSRSRKMLLIVAAFAVSLFVGNDQDISYLLSLSRVLVLFPFFILGYYFRHSGFFHALGDHAYRASRHFIRLRTLLGCLVVIILFGLLKVRSIVNPKWLYDSYSYDDLNYNVWIRGIFMVCALIITAFLLLSVPNIHIPVITRIGEHTLPIFLMHGFCIKLIDYYHVFDHIAYKQIGVLILTVAITCLFSSPLMNKLLAPLLKFSGQRTAKLCSITAAALQHVINSLLSVINGKHSLSYHRS